ncbi:unnamed protein product [Orchesella dallaii]|uniref:Calponin-homology (CH) domain-containing protein n=1 Tax=Orchesella dallaii TaxID=48710 RepID=A0ABP1QGL0_9HEXA
MRQLGKTLKTQLTIGNKTLDIQKVEKTFLKWIAYHTANANLSINDRLQLVSLSNEMAADPVVLSSRYFCVTYQQLSALVEKDVTLKNIHKTKNNSAACHVDVYSLDLFLFSEFKENLAQVKCSSHIDRGHEQLGWVLREGSDLVRASGDRQITINLRLTSKAGLIINLTSHHRPQRSLRDDG